MLQVVQVCSILNYLELSTSISNTVILYYCHLKSSKYRVNIASGAGAQWPLQLLYITLKGSNIFNRHIYEKTCTVHSVGQRKSVFMMQFNNN